MEAEGVSGSVIQFWWTAPRVLSTEEAAAISEAIELEGRAAAEAVWQAILDEAAENGPSPGSLPAPGSGPPRTRCFPATDGLA